MSRSPSDMRMDEDTPEKQGNRGRRVIEHESPNVNEDSDGKRDIAHEETPIQPITPIRRPINKSQSQGVGGASKNRRRRRTTSLTGRSSVLRGQSGGNHEIQTRSNSNGGRHSRQLLHEGQYYKQRYKELYQRELLMAGNEFRY